jgi:hypothetical protein
LQVLSDPKQRKAYDEGEDIHTLQPFPIAEEVTRYYFPEKRGLNVSASRGFENLLVGPLVGAERGSVGGGGEGGVGVMSGSCVR